MTSARRARRRRARGTTRRPPASGSSRADGRRQLAHDRDHEGVAVRLARVAGCGVHGHAPTVPGPGARRYRGFPRTWRHYDRRVERRRDAGATEAPDVLEEALEDWEPRTLAARFEIEDARLGGADLSGVSAAGGRVARSRLDGVNLSGSRMRS